jgi:hypothetical protein
LTLRDRNERLARPSEILAVAVTVHCSLHFASTFTARRTNC